MVALSALMTVLLPGCGGDSGGSGAPDRLGVVASVYPLAEVVRTVGADRVRVSDLTPAGAEPHDLELGPPEVEALEDADLVVYLGRGFQPAVEKVAGRAGARAVEVLGELGLTGNDDDPHVWLDPVLMSQLVSVVERSLAGADPEGADGYRARAAALRARLEELDTEYRAGLAECQRRVIVTAHEAFGRLAARYRLEQVAIAGISPDAEPDPRHLAELADLVRRRGVTTVFTEELVSPKVADTLARETGTGTAVLRTLETLADEDPDAGVDYVGSMRSNLTTLRTALGCR